MRVTSFESFTHPFFVTYTEIARPLYLGNNHVGAFLTHKIYDSKVSSALEIYPNLA